MIVLMSRPISIPSKRGKRVSVSVVADRAATIYKYQRKPCLLNAIEEAMDELDYDGDVCIDDIADMIACKRLVKNVDDEQIQLKLAQKKMDKLVQFENAGSYGSDKSWNPTPPTQNEQWIKTLDTLDMIHSKYETMVSQKCS